MGVRAAGTPPPAGRERGGWHSGQALGLSGALAPQEAARPVRDSGPALQLGPHHFHVFAEDSMG